MRELTDDEKDTFARMQTGKDRWIYRLTLSEREALVLKAYYLGVGRDTTKVKQSGKFFIIDSDKPEWAEGLRQVLIEILGGAPTVQKVAR